MKSSLSLFAQFRLSWSAILLVLGISTTLIGVVLLLHLFKGFSIGELTRDPVAVLQGSIFIGFLSQVGIFFWAASAAICMFSAYVIPRSSDTTQLKNFLIASGLLTLVLAIDDVFLMHERVLPYIGVPQILVYLIYIGLILFYFIRFHSIILKSEYILLGMALGFFGVSVALDVIHPKGIDPNLFEDGAKFVGIVAWLAYFIRFGAFAVLHNTAQQPLSSIVSRPKNTPLNRPDFPGVSIS